MFRSLTLVMLSLLAAGASAWARSPVETGELVAGQEARLCLLGAHGEPQRLRLDLPAPERGPLLLDARAAAPLPRVGKQRWFWDTPSWQPLTW
jgi:hypothetical protein